MAAHAHRVDWESLQDETGWVPLLLPFEKLEFAKAAILGFGADIEVLSPGEPRREMVATTTALHALYGRCQPG